MRLGEFTIHSCSDGLFRLDGGAMFGIVPRVLWERTDPPDDKNRILLALRSLLIQTGEVNILVDTGIGSKGDQKLRDIYMIDRNPPLEGALAAHGLTPGDIDIVINTHLHLDHAGGNTCTGDGGGIVPAFPGAKYVIQKGEWEDAANPDERSRGSYIAEDFLPLEGFKGAIEFIDGMEVEVVTGVSVMVTGGHTPFHQCVKVESGGEAALFLADLVPTASHLPLPYMMAYDLVPRDTLRAKKHLLKRAVEEEWLVVFQHDPRVEAGYLRMEGERPVLREEVKL
ncbi:MAG: MBL fold metallo-hydrolase [Candidatus Brocadiales bacterium]|nr:MBL fold metallo-hydrolase [Candidatus Bathyanammoxibius amoris]